MASQPVSQVLQKAYLLATGKAANAATLARFESLVSAGDYTQIGREVESTMATMAKSVGVVATVQAIARNGMDLDLTDLQAAAVVDALTAKGVDSWAKLFNYCIELQDDGGKLLDNRAQAAQSFNNKVAALGKTALLANKQVDAAVQEFLLGIDATPESVSRVIEGLNGLATQLKPGGFHGKMADGYVAGATVFVDTNENGVRDEGEFSTTTDADGNFTIPDDVDGYGPLVGYGGTDIMTGLAFKGTLTAPAGSTVLNPLTTVYYSGGKTVKTTVKSKVLQQIYNTDGDLIRVARTKKVVKETKLTYAKTLGINDVMSYDPIAVLKDPNASQTQKSQALEAQKTAVQMANVMTQLTAMLVAAMPGETFADMSEYVQYELEKFLKVNAPRNGKKWDLTDPALLGKFVRGVFDGAELFDLMGASTIGQIAAIMADSNEAVQTATNLAGISRAAKVAQGDALDALVDSVSKGSFDDAARDFTDDALTRAVAAKVIPPSPETPAAPPPAPDPGPAPAPAPAPAGTFTAAVDEGAISFDGTATGNITLSWAGAAGASVATFTRGGVTATTTANFGGSVKGIQLASGQVLSASLADISGVSVRGAGGLVVTGSTTGDDTLTMGGGIQNVTWDALGGNDKLVLSTGTTVNYTLTGVETVEGGAGVDTVVLANAQTTLTFDGKGGDDKLTLANGGNTVTLTLTDAETLHGGTGADVMTLATAVTGLQVDGKGGTDSLTLSDAASTVTATAVATVTGGAQGDTITVTGATGATISGGGGNDTLTGGAGDDIFIGGVGTDTINLANGGADVVRLDHLSADTLNGFDAGSGDKIQLSKAVFTALGAVGPLSGVEYGESNGGAAATAAQRLFFDTGASRLYYDINGSGEAGVTLIAILTGVTTLSAANFEIVA